jgi:serine/threonine-protein kinase HipA
VVLLPCCWSIRPEIVRTEDKYKKRSYANIASVLWAETGDKGKFEFVRRLVFSVVIGNADMHLKNWSLRAPANPESVLRFQLQSLLAIPHCDPTVPCLSRLGWGRT